MLASAARRIGALVLKLQVRVLALVAAVAGVFAAAVLLILVGAGVSGSGSSDAAAFAAMFAFIPIAGLILFLVGRRASRVVNRGEAALDEALESADRKQRRLEEARAGGPPGQLSVVAPDQAGELSTAIGAGALSKREGQTD